MRRFIEAVHENNRLRQKVEEALVGHMQDFVLAAFGKRPYGGRNFAVPMREINLHIEQENIMSVRVPKMHAHIANPYGDDEGDVVYSYVASNSQMDETIEDMSNLLPDLLRQQRLKRAVS